MPGEGEQKRLASGGQPKSARARPAEGATAASPPPDKKPPREIGGPQGPEPTRYGDWERGGRCIDF